MTVGVMEMAKLLFVLTGATYWVFKDGTRYATAYWAEEFAARTSSSRRQVTRSWSRHPAA